MAKTSATISEFTKHKIFRRLCPEGQRVTRLTWFEQSWYGLIDVQMDCGEQQIRFTNNNRGRPNTAKVCRGGVSAVQGREQGGYGIINTRMWCSGEDHYLDSNRNHRGAFQNKLDCGGKVMTGLEVREQPRYGIINFKAHCTSLPDGESIFMFKIIYNETTRRYLEGFLKLGILVLSEA